MNEHQEHMHDLLKQAANVLRSFQLYEIGAGHGHVDNDVNNDVTLASRAVWTAINRIQPPKF